MAHFKKFIQASDAILEFEADFNAVQAHDVFSLGFQSEELKALWKKVKVQYEVCLDQFNDKTELEEIEAIKQKYRSCYQAYLRVAAKISELRQTKPSEQTIASDIGMAVGHSMPVPPCDTEVFSGDYLSWPSFRDMFTAIYITNMRLTAVEKLFHLNKKTSGEAKEIVRKSPLTNDGFAQAWQDLSDRYENKRILVNSQLKILFNLPNVPKESGTELQKLQRDINGCIYALHLHKIAIDNWDAIFVYLCSTRLPEITLSLWEQSITNKNEVPRWADLDSFLTNRFQTLETVSDIRSGSGAMSRQISLPSTLNHSTSRSHQSSLSGKRVNSYQLKVSQTNCKLCTSEQHGLRSCPTFLRMDAKERLLVVRKHNFCINCLSSGHQVKECKSQFTCVMCKQRHNTLLHRDSNLTSTPASSVDSSRSNVRSNLTGSNTQAHSAQLQSTSIDIQTGFCSSTKNVLLGTAMVTVCHLGTAYTTRALIDSGSEGTFVSERLQKLLKLPTRAVNAQVSGLNNAVSAQVSRACDIILSSPKNRQFQIEATAFVLSRLTGNLPSCSIDPSLCKNLPDLQLADPHFFRSDQIDVLIGGDVYPAIILDGIQRNVFGSLLAQETVFGWIFTGPIPHSSISSFTTCLSFHNEIAIDQQIARFWELEELPKKQLITESDQFCEENYQRTTKRDAQGRYIVTLPFKNTFPETTRIGFSRSIAFKQFIRGELRLTKNPDLKSQYDEVLQEYLKLDHMKKVSPPKFESSPSHFYLPHHAVLKPESATTKLRVVFNASSASSSGASLNDVLHAGPVLQADLTLLILKWRFYKYVFNGDIQQMYRQILVDPKHSSYQRILHRSSPHEEIQDFELKTVTFGVNCAPYLAIRTMLRLADDVQNQFPLAAQILRHFLYVDDALAGAHEVDSAIEARNQLISALSTAGFTMRKWTANHPGILAGTPTEHLMSENFLKLEDASCAKALGVRWNAASDLFYFSAQRLAIKPSYTKREVLSIIAQLFDPAGWLAPIVVTAKILMQRIWLDNIDWDENITTSSSQSWQTFLSDYGHINNIRIPRYVDFSPSYDVEFHAFSDASEKAYAASIYIRVKQSDCIITHLLYAKTRVAPVKTVSLPRLELCGAVLLADMVDTLLSHIEINKHKLFCWTDSTIVLAWLCKPPCSWTTFVANRVTTIAEKVGVTNWFHVESHENPADLATRGVTPQDLTKNALWWHGPSWLSLERSSWRTSALPPDVDTPLERKSIRVNFAYFSEHDDVLERFSSLPRALRVLSYVFRFFHRTHPLFRASFCRKSKCLANAEIKAVKTRLMLLCQKVNFPAEYHILDTKQPISSKSSLLALNPFLHTDKLLRVGGRLASSPNLSFDERHPIILPYNCNFSRLLVRFIHEISLHGGNQLMLRLIRTQYWIFRARNLIKTTIYSCKTCVIYKKQLRTQIMAALPPERTIISRPFSSTGIDFAGPFDIKSYIGRSCRISKGYVCLFVCFSTKAVHLEATSDLSTATFLAAFSRFVARRGCPANVYTDNGTNFVGASNILKKDFQTFMMASREAALAQHACQDLAWHFIPAGAPHMGGLWEAGVKSFKTHFKKIAGNMKYTFEEFTTLLNRIESCLNSRPLTAMSEDPGDLQSLTPGHFLIGGPLLAPAEPEIADQPLTIVNRWQRIKAMHQHFCSRWKNEYLKEMHKRVKWKTPQMDFSVDDLVVVKEDNLPANEWRLGRVIRIYQGRDKRIRVADIRTERGCITRPIVKLVALPTT